jgi:hypothetical protein
MMMTYYLSFIYGISLLKSTVVFVYVSDEHILWYILIFSYHSGLYTPLDFCIRCPATALTLFSGLGSSLSDTPDDKQMHVLNVMFRRTEKTAKYG